MPDFKASENSGNGRGRKNGAKSDKGKGMVRASDVQIVEPRCNVCKSKHRHAIDRELALGTPHTHIARAYDMNRRSIGRHARSHLNLEEAALRNLVEREAQRHNENVEFGIDSIMRNRIYLEAVIEKAHREVIDGEAEIEVRDAIAAIEKLDRLDEKVGQDQVAEMRRQVEALLQAVQEVVDPGAWDQIVKRTQELTTGKSHESLPDDTSE